MRKLEYTLEKNSEKIRDFTLEAIEKLGLKLNKRDKLLGFNEERGNVFLDCKNDEGKIIVVGVHTKKDMINWLDDYIHDEYSLLRDNGIELDSENLINDDISWLLGDMEEELYEKVKEDMARDYVEELARLQDYIQDNYLD